MVKKLISVITMFVMAIAICTFMSVTARAEGDSMDDAKTIEIGQKIKEQNPGGTVEKWFKFTASKDETSWHRIGVIPGENGGTITIFDTENKELLYEHILSSYEKIYHLKFEPNKEYFVKLRLASNKASLYTFYLEEIKDAVGSDEEHAETIFSGIKKIGMIDCAADKDMYVFSAGASKSSIMVTSKYPQGVALNVYNEDGAEILSESILDKESRTYQFDTIKGETYYIKASNRDKNNASNKYSGQYVLVLKSGSTDLSKMEIHDILNKSQDIYAFNGKVRLSKDTDYTVSVKKNSNGKASVTIKGKGNYSGTVVKECTVVN